MKTALVLALLLLQAKANPEYACWSRFAAGSWVRYKAEASQRGVSVTIKMTRTLLELSAEKAVVEKASVAVVGEQEIPGEKEKETIAAGDEKGFKILQNTEDLKEAGEEEIEVAGKKMKCRVLESVTREGRKYSVRLWLAGDIPGGIARAEVKGDGAAGSMKLQAVSWEKK